MNTSKALKSIPAPVSGRQKRYLTEHLTCPMCETDLIISHEINSNDNKVKEEAHCPQCGVRARTVNHPLN